MFLFQDLLLLMFEFNYQMFDIDQQNLAKFIMNNFVKNPQKIPENKWNFQ